MSMSNGVWTEKKISKMQADGVGKGKRSDYVPWIQVKDVSSRGRSRRIWSPKTRRTHHLLSDVEYQLFVALEWQLDIVDIRERYPLDRGITQDIARSLGIAHPYYRGTQIPTVMTVDFLVTVERGHEAGLVAYNAKTAGEAEDERSLLKLEIQREYFQRIDVEHHVVFDCDIPRQNVANIGDIREAPLRPDELEPRPGYFTDLCRRMLHDMPVHPPTLSLEAYCSEFDCRYGCAPGVGIRVARILMFERLLVPDLSSPALSCEPLSKFVVMSTSTLCHASGEQ
jgi:hypothetical protein